MCIIEQVVIDFVLIATLVSITVLLVASLKCYFNPCKIRDKE